ncbi:uncharacterized protein J3R85_021232 [Psidium guajava]|nr:uncharacterized protein J3R85_021232 [Psidium guajava]
MEAHTLEMFEVGPCETPYQMGFSIGQRFSRLIQSRLSRDLILQNQLLPWARAPESRPLLESLCENNRNNFPRYWDELVGTAEGSGVPVLDIVLINFRKEILPFIPEKETNPLENAIECSDISAVGESMAVAAHNEDANVALVGHTYLIKGTLSNGLCFISYTYAGELPSCAFGFNNNGMGFTLNAVPPSKEEIVAGGIGRNFISRDLLEATSMENATKASVGHSYNLIDLEARSIRNIETASSTRISVNEVDETPFFHANMYLHLRVQQAEDENSISRQKRAAMLPKNSKQDFLSLLGDTDDAKYPIYMSGPTLYTLCTALVDLDERTLRIIKGNPKKGEISHAFSLSSPDLKKLC